MDTQRQKVGMKMLQNILGYYGLFQYPLTAYEFYNYQYFEDTNTEHFSLKEIDELLTSEDSEKYISQKEGFYFLNGNEGFVDRRLKYYRYSVEKYNYALGKFKWLRLLPGIRMIAICNSLPLHNTEDEADIDMFIITEPKRIWTTRFFVVLFLKLFRLRPTQGNNRNKLCPSFFISKNDMSLEKYQNGEDAYFRNWVSQVVAFYDQDNTFDKYWLENKWMKSYLPAVQPNLLPDYLQIHDSSFVKLVKKLFEKVAFLFSEKTFSSIQLKKLPKDIIDKANRPGSSVVLKSSILKFHTKDRRNIFNDKFKDIKA